MYLDVLSAAAYGRYNIKLANLTNLDTACYWSCLLDIIARVVKKNKFDSDGYFTLDRKYVKQQTTLTTEKQLKCDETLEQLQVLKRHSDDNNKIAVSLENMTSLLVESDVSKLKKLIAENKKSPEERLEAKRAAIVAHLQSGLSEPDEDLRNLYCQWIDVCYDKGICRAPQVKAFTDAVNNYSADVEVRKAVVQKAIILGYRDAAWAIERYEQQVKKQPAIADQQIVSKFDAEYEF